MTRICLHTYYIEAYYFEVYNERCMSLKKKPVSYSEASIITAALMLDNGFLTKG